MSPALASACAEPVTLPELLRLVDEEGWAWVAGERATLRRPDGSRCRLVNRTARQSFLEPVVDFAALRLPPERPDDPET
jgi:hypothetical protein